MSRSVGLPSNGTKRRGEVPSPRLDENIGPQDDENTQDTGRETRPRLLLDHDEISNAKDRGGEVPSPQVDETLPNGADIKETGRETRPRLLLDHAEASNAKDRVGEVLSPRLDENIGPQEGEIAQDMGGETPPRLLLRPTLGQIVAYYKYQSTKKMNLLDGSGVITKFWQRNYHEHIIRDAAEWDRIRRYIESNPSHWKDDDQNPTLAG